MSATVEWAYLAKPAFLARLRGLAPKERAQINEKIDLLTLNPLPDGKARKLLKHLGDHMIYRLRAGDFRVFYSLQQATITLLLLDRRDEKTYDRDIEPEKGQPSAVAIELTGDEPWLAEEQEDEPSFPAPAVWHPGEVEQPQAESKALEQPITAALLNRLRVPAEFHAALTAIQTEENLLSVDVPQDYLLQLIEVVTTRPLHEVLRQPDLITPLEDLQRYAEGDLVGFLLQLSEEQQRTVGWALNAAGPTLVKGGPGTGKSTIAIYRVREMLGALRKVGISSPRILFTTYTKALAAYSEQLIETLLGEDRACVDVRNVDKVVMEHAGPRLAGRSVQNQDVCLRALEQALGEVQLDGNPLEQAAQRATLARLTLPYLLEEFDGVIEARRISSLEDYAGVPRPGRAVPLNSVQRRAVWQAYRAFQQVMGRRKWLTWGRLHRFAAECVVGIQSTRQYDAVIVDEAQDLDPNTLRLLVLLCRTSNRLFVAADANQSIYGGSFRWQDVHDSLKFRGRTSVLTRNYRSTAQIGAAAHSYLSDGGIDRDQPAQEYRSTGPLPQVCLVESAEDEARLVADFLRWALSIVKLGIGSCAVGVPTEAAGRALADRLTAAGLPAQHMAGHQLDLKRQCVKVITLKSAKGLEFPIVALAGFVGSRYPLLPPGADEEQAEILARERRTMFVAMTRAMRVLLVTLPADRESPLFKPFDSQLWTTV